MKIHSITSRFINFEGKRQDRKNVEQLKKNNPYDLNVINQRNIQTAIENLSNEGGAENAKFLLDVSKHLKYGTNIDLGKTPNHDWRAELNEAAKKSIEKAPKKEQKKLYAQMKRAEKVQRPLTAPEREILNLREAILSKVDRDVLENIKYTNVKNFDRNFDYLISSSEISVAQKLHIMKKLNYLMSPKYKINPQLADKKTQVLAEMVNDMVINTPESEIPNIKSVNQLSVGSCAAISICRKKMAYEDKANYVDMILSELDDKDYMMIYDISKLGSHTKIPVNKPYIDYDYAMKQGYRILDASALNWMNAADTTGRVNEATKNYIAFDKTFFDTFTDGHIISDISEELSSEQDYYRALMKAKAAIKECKKDVLGKQLNSKKVKTELSKNLDEIQRYTNSLNSMLGELSPTSTKENRRQVLSDLRSLEVENSRAVAKSDKQGLKEFMYIPNEPDKVKANKIKKYLATHLDYVNEDLLNKKADYITELLSSISDATKATQLPEEDKIRNAKNLYKAAAAYRIQTEFGLDNIYKTCDTMRELGLPDRESLIFNNIDDLIKKLNKGTLNPVVKETLANRFQADSPEALIESLEFNRKNLQHEMTATFDDLYKSCMLGDRKSTLLKNLEAIKGTIVEDKNRETLKSMAFNMGMKPDKRQVVSELDKLIDIMNDSPSEEDYLYAYNKAGGRNQMLDFKTIMENLGEILRNNDPDSRAIIREFNEANGLPKDAPRQASLEKFVEIGEKFNKLSFLTKAFQEALEVRDEDGTVLNTVIPKEVIMKKLEQEHKVVTAKDLADFQDKFATIAGARQLPNGSRLEMKDLPKELTTFSKHEKEVMKEISGNLNKWYSATTRNLDAQYKVIEKPLKEHFRQLGVTLGSYWLPNDGQSGLYSRQQVRIIESMTDKPHYIEKDGNVAIAKILNSPYSGISSTSVFTDGPGMHAQYIADIKQVPVKTKDGVEAKYAIFHDNTWGAVEHENSWRDENGLLRTDYNNNAGGDGGYITGENFRNGVLAEDVIDTLGENKVKDKNSKQYRKLLGADGEAFKFQMLPDIIVQGESTKARDLSSSIKYTTTQEPDKYFKDLKEMAQNMTRDELQQKINLIDTVPKAARQNYERIEARIMRQGNFNNGIDTKAKYDALPDNDEVKLLFETYAALDSYYAIPDKKQFFINSLSPKKIAKLKTQIRQEARKNFDYVFAKNPEFAMGGNAVSYQEVMSLLKAFSKDNDLNLTTKQMTTIVNSLEQIDKSKFDGSLKHTIKLMTDSFKTTLEQKSKAKIPSGKVNELTQKVHDILTKNMYFDEKDMESVDFRRDNMPAIEKWIDDTFKPATDEEFVKIFRKLQDMPLDNFKSKYNSTITDSALGIKPITGYEVLKKFRAENDKVQNGVFGLVYNLEHYNSFDESETKPYYRYSKLGRVLAGAEYLKKSFDDTFLEYHGEMESLTLDKLFNKYAKRSYDKYNTFPAYAKVETENPEAIANSLIDLKASIEDSIADSALNKKILNIVSDVREFQAELANLDDNSTLPERLWRKIGPFAVNFYAENSKDETIQNSVQAVKDIINTNPNETTVKEYKDKLQIVADDIFPYEKTKAGETRENNVKLYAEKIKVERQYFVTESIDPKYQPKANVLLNKWIKAKAQNSKDADMYFGEFVAFYNKHRITLSPDKLFLEYMMMLAKPTPSNNPYKNMTDSQKEMLENVKKSYETEIKSLLYSAKLVKLQTILMRAARDGNLNKVKSELQNTKMKLLNGEQIDLCSSAGLIIMLRSLIEENDLDTALMFIDQLGLNELAVETFATKFLSFDSGKQIIKRLYNIFDAVDKQVAYADKEFKNLGDIDNDPDYKEHLEQYRDKIVKYCNHTNFRSSGRLLKLAVVQTLADIEKYPERSKSAILSENMSKYKAVAVSYAKKNVDQYNDVLKRFDTVNHLLHQINLPRNSGVEHYVEEYEKKMNELEDYTSKFSIDFKNIDVSVGINADLRRMADEAAALEEEEV